MVFFLAVMSLFSFLVFSLSFLFVEKCCGKRCWLPTFDHGELILLHHIIRIAIWIGNSAKLVSHVKVLCISVFKLPWRFDPQQDDAPMAISPCKGWRICLYLL